ncbi:MAG: tetratricopeptide repeat protein [Ignavibacteriaceae bacterium]|nr:tetratricopeptide repeat protein [Ignavibacteriaceae bacterium]
MEYIYNNFAVDLQELLMKYLSAPEMSSLLSKVSLMDKTEKDERLNLKEIYRQQLDIEFGNFNERIQLDRTVTYTQKNLSPEKFSKMLINLGKLCISHGKLSIAHELLNKANRNNGNKATKAETLLAMADLYARKANWDSSIIAVRKARFIYSALKDSNGIAKCENIIGTIYGDQGEFHEAKACFEKSLSILNPSDDPELIASIRANLGVIEVILGNKDKAINYLNNAIDNFKLTGNYKRIAELKHNIGLLHYELTDYESASKSYDECIDIALKNSFIPVLCLAYLGKANLFVSSSEYLAAEIYADKALELSHYLDDKLTIADIYKTKGIIERNLKNFTNAENYLLSSLRLNNELKNDLNIAETSFELAVLYDEIERPDQKEEHLKDSLNYYARMQSADRIRKIEEIFSINRAYSSAS